MVVLKKVKTFAELVKFEHTIFALPFAYLGAFLGKWGWPGWYEFIWITLAMFGARSSAMGFNRVIDRFIDAANPRTNGRPLPQGKMKSSEVVILSILAFGLLVWATYKLSPWHVIYLPIILAILVGYSYTKRFTWACHLVLGIAISFAPLGGWIAVTGEMSKPAFLLAGIVACWIAGFDIIYATQDYDFDKKTGLHSIPVRFGLEKGLLISQGLHLVVIILLVILYLYLPLGRLFLVGISVTAILLIYEHSLVSAHDLSKVNVAFFNINGVISILLFIFTLLDIYL
ncbi:MAG: 4-hydroxybenzoate polyprenyltransferase [Clostridia bacterium]|jgi:4-hydroxybenzoate polyprenyltransferase|nr:4-hydroxybenzoate polyprenyltransferase [Clostridia bacterium]MDN5322429.1 4-hydroxybenzoate polyprenyltransferase [Clostridia bacterium]